MGLNSSCCQDEDPPAEVIQPEVLHCQAQPAEEEEAHDQVRKSTKQSTQAMDGNFRPPSKTSRLRKMSHLVVDTEIIRGIELRETLHRRGSLWRCSPLDLSVDQREQLWERSRPVEGFDIFLSHTWLTSGKWKIIALILQSSWKVGLAVWTAAASSAMILSVLDVLPTPGVWEVRVADFSGSCPLGSWVIVLGFLGTFFGMVLSMYIPRRWNSSGTCFFDVVP